ncbi:amino acid ABC transporter ATP-binding protein [Candidatus Marimicrobium litorale]|uniref:Amino acid ABC transporter ATP-binding protein n=1 Tax=Candidatus Marimicrobium litorale TaxID=2518991 RepID=A0ABT3T972_9GAMM|nr:amino acid ABC transporter ATP-binding protein [Candidatus Marimicrobium litorale]MCX2978833.1 amino acid ABC transporter ATP-binding protein [Candidatus Marimicrobium litorale]
MSVIRIRDLVKQYDGLRALDGVDLDLAEGEIKVIMGPSGCGKSTLLRCLNRLVEPTSGSIHFLGEDITSSDVDVRQLRQQIGFVFQQFALYRHLSVLDNVTLALRKLQGMSRAEADVKAMAELAGLGMTSHSHKYPSQISGGQKQRVAIARALAMNPAVIVFDEPTSALDPIMSREVGALIQTLNTDNVTILCVTHDLELGQYLSNEVTFLDQGRVVAEASFEYLSNGHSDARVRDFFGRKA